MEELEILIEILKGQLEVTNQCLPQCSIQENLRVEIKALETALDILDHYRPALIEGCVL